MSKKAEYIKGLSNYHKALENLIEQNYGIKTDFLDIMGWGYTTTAFYIKTKAKDYIARVSAFSPEKDKSIKKEVFLSNKLHKVLPTVTYVANKNGSDVTYFDNSILRISEHVQGLLPFSMDFDIFTQAILFLKLIHSQKVAGFPLETYTTTKNPVFLHGDLTPSNFLVSYGKICGILDFEMAMLGPAEWDLSRTSVFCWFRMDNVRFDKVVAHALAVYNKPDINFKLLFELSKKHLITHLENIEKHKNTYHTLQEWKTDYSFTYNKLQELSTL